MVSVGLGIPSHDVLSGVTSGDHHSQIHIIPTHGDTTATGAELNTLTDGSDADALHAHTPNKEIIFQPTFIAGLAFPYDVQQGSKGTVTLVDNALLNFTFHIPDDFVSLVSAILILVPDATETIQLDLATAWGVPDEGPGDTVDTVVDLQKAVTANKLEEIDISGALTGIGADDYVGLLVTSNITKIEPMIGKLVYA